MNTQQPLSFWQKNRLVLKSFFIGFLILALLIPTFLIMSLVNERQERKQAVTGEISNKWSAAQTITGPYLIIPYYETENSIQVKKNLYILPEELNIDGNIEPSIRYRSIFKVPVYTVSPLTLKGKFIKHSLGAVNIDPGQLKWNEAKFCLGISDLKGIKEQIIKWNGHQLTIEPGLSESDIAGQGVKAVLPLDSAFLNAENEFSIQLTLQGSEKLFFAPMGSNTKAHVTSKWSNPAFDGKYLPDSEQVAKDHFEANWKISQFNRDFPKLFVENVSVKQSVENSAFGVVLLSPFDAYAQTLRSLKYAILVIALSFFTYFFTEIFQRRAVHPFQYILIGMALVVFYTLLLSLSEYILFSLAYLIASVATISLLSFYTFSIFKKMAVTGLFALMLSLVYLFIYVLIQMQDKALLFGSIGLFSMLALAMHFSRKIDWYGIDSKINGQP